MNKLRRFFNKNFKSIYIVILAIVFILLGIQILNLSIKNDNAQRFKDEAQNRKYTEGTTAIGKYSVITQESIDESESKILVNTIENFINSCNSGKIVEAYNLISADCKEELYPTLDDFKIYYKKIFSEKRDYKINLWYPDIRLYKVEYMDDVMATGKINQSKIIEELYTVVLEDNKEKINISGFIGKSDINKSIKKDDIEISINYKKVFVDCEIYNITIKNNTKDTMILNSNEKNNTIYILGDNDTKYSAYVYELNSEEVRFMKYQTKTLNIKFAKNYLTNARIKQVVFSDIIKNNEEYIKNSKDSKNRLKIEVEI